MPQVLTSKCFPAPLHAPHSSVWLTSYREACRVRRTFCRLRPTAAKVSTNASATSGEGRPRSCRRSCNRLKAIALGHRKSAGWVNLAAASTRRGLTLLSQLVERHEPDNAARRAHCGEGMTAWALRANWALSGTLSVDFQFRRHPCSENSLLNIASCCVG